MGTSNVGYFGEYSTAVGTGSSPVIVFDSNCTSEGITITLDGGRGFTWTVSDDVAEIVPKRVPWFNNGE